MKLPVAAAALSLLGRDFRWETAFFADATPVDGILSVPLYLRGTGDPTLGAPFFPSSTEALAALADSLHAAGVRRVTGPLIVDASGWDSTTVPESWMVGNLSPSFGATGGAFTVGKGEVALRISGGRTPGELASIDWSPRGRGDFVQGTVVTGATGAPAEVRTDFLSESRRWVLSGSVAVGDSLTLTLAARDPVRLATEALARTIEERGVVLEGGVRIEWGGAEPSFPVGDTIAEPEIVIAPGDAIASGESESAGSTPGDAIAGGVAENRGESIDAGRKGSIRIAGIFSPPLSEVIRVTLDTSQNWMTEQVVRTLGAEVGEHGSWNEGFRVIEEHLAEEMRIDSLEIHMEDGSGLSAYNLLTPRAIVRILLHAQTRLWGDDFRTALPSPGRPGGTLDRRLAGLEGRVQAKTGTIMNVNSLSGYLLTDDGAELVFSILSNGSNLPAAQIRERMDAIVRELAAGS